MHPYTKLAATLIVLVGLVALLFPPTTQRTHAAEGVLMLPEGGRLEAFDNEGNLIGPCPLKHTDVDVQISGHFSRVTVRQQYVNTYENKIEAVYTFPLSHRGAVDRMTMTVGDRVIEGEVKERRAARQIYEAARDQGYVASLLEQERPNIFTQSVANIEPGAEVLIEISYIEVLQSVDGEYRFEFPMVVAPRYIPGYPAPAPITLPESLQPRRGVILLGPAELTADGAAGATLAPQRLAHLLREARPITQPPASYWGAARQPQVLHHFTAEYPTAAQEFGMLHADGTGQLNGRWFFYDAEALTRGGGFSPDTDQVPDASRITPMPVRPEVRAGHDIGVSVTIDTGGPGLRQISSPQHEVTQRVLARGEDGTPQRVALSLKGGRDIPNRDFLLTWRQTGDAVNEAIFTHTGEYGEYGSGFFTLVLQPPDRVPAEMIRPREIVFVLDNSGSMLGRSAQLAGGVSALDAAKRVIRNAIDTMRPEDRFNVISFNNTLDALWPEPRENSPENRAAAQRYVDQRQGGGGTEMRNAVLRALEAGPFKREDRRPRLLAPLELANLPADGRDVQVRASMDQVFSVNGVDRFQLVARDDLRIDLRMNPQLFAGLPSDGVQMELRGRWTTQDGRRVLNVAEVKRLDGDDEDAEPMRIVLFVTDGLVGNDSEIIRAVRENAHRTRVFTIGMSRSPNRHLLDEMALAGRGAVDYVLPDDDVDPIVQRFADRIATPVLTDIEVEFDGVKVSDLLAGLHPGDALPDLFDVQPLVIHGRYHESSRGTLTIRGRTGAGPYVRTIEIDLPEAQPKHDVIATLWARSKVVERERAGDVPGVVALGETFGIVTEHTSFVAVEKQRVTVGGRPMLVRVPIEFPEDMSWEGVFGGERKAVERAVVEFQRANPDLRRSEIEMMFTGEEIRSLLPPQRHHLVSMEPSMPKAAPQRRGIGGVVQSDSRLGSASRRNRVRQQVAPVGRPPAPGSAPGEVRVRGEYMADGASLAGGLGGGGGRGIFGPAPESTVMVPLTPEEHQQCVIDIVQSLIQPDAWYELGGGLAKIEATDRWPGLGPVPLEDSEQARNLVRAAEQLIDQFRPIFSGEGGKPSGDETFRSTAPDGSVTIVAAHHVADLLAAQGGTSHEAAEAIIDTLTGTIDPDGWMILGGNIGEMHYINGWLLIRTTPENHDAVRELLAQLRLVLGLPLTDADRAAAETAQQRTGDVSDGEIVVGVYTLRRRRPASPGATDDAEQMRWRIMDSVTQAVDPDGWAGHGGDVSDWSEFAGVIIIRTRAENHRAIEAILGPRE